MARRALFHARNRELDLFAECRFLERELEVVADVGAALGDWAARARTAPRATAEEHVEDVAEALGTAAAKAAESSKAALAAKTAEAAGAASTAGIRRVKAEAVILCALLRILEDVVGDIDLFHLLFCGLRIVAVEVRMILARQFPIGLLDVSIGSIPADPEDLI